MDTEDLDLLEALDRERCKEKYIQNIRIKTRSNLQPVIWLIVAPIGLFATIIFLLVLLIVSKFN